MSELPIKLFLAFLVLSLGGAGPSYLLAQTTRAPRIEWQQTVGGTENDWPTRIVEMPDGGFAVGGVSYSGVSGNKTSPIRDTGIPSTDFDETGDAWVVRFSNLGIKQWDCSYGGVGADALVDLAPANDGGVFVGGTGFRGEVIPLPYPGDPTNQRSLLIGSRDYFIARTDATGRTLWQQFLGGDNHDYFAGLAVGPDHTVTVGGSSISPVGGNKTAPHFGDYDAWIARLDPVGNKIWDRSFGGTASDQLGLVRETSDGGMILCGVSFSESSGNKSSPAYGRGDVWLLRLDSAGEKLWEQSLGGTGYETPLKLYEMPDGGFILGCGSASPISGNKTSPSLDATLGGDFWVVRVNAQGAILWDKTFGTESWDLMLDFQATAAGGAILSGVRFADPVTRFLLLPFEFHLTQIDANGTELWSKVFDADSTTAVNWSSSRILALPDQGVLIGTISFADGTNSLKTSLTHGSADCWLLRLDSRGNKLWDLSLGGGSFDELTTLDRCQDGGFIVGMASESALIEDNGNKTHRGYGKFDMWVVKLTPELPPDSDGDGVSDDLDQCPNSPAGSIVNATGCSIEQIVSCDGPWKNHGEYVSAVAQASTQFRNSGLISPQQRMAIFSQAVKSDCGREERGKGKLPLSTAKP